LGALTSNLCFLTSSEWGMPSPLVPVGLPHLSSEAPEFDSCSFPILFWHFWFSSASWSFLTVEVLSGWHLSVVI
jgi:hypothetical protein